MPGIVLIGFAIVAFGVIGAAIWLIVVLFQPAKKDKVAADPKPIIQKKPASRGSRSWILYLIIALLLSIWTIAGALFFIAVVWVMRQNPNADSTYAVSAIEKKTATRIYTWLFFSSFITVPVFIGVLFSSSPITTNELVFATLIPVVFHLPLLAGLNSKSAFVYRHTQQGILLVALRVAMASLAMISVNEIDFILGLILFPFGNGSLWLFGSIWGWNQVGESKCWLMTSKGEQIHIPDNIFSAYPANKNLELSRDAIRRFKQTEARDHALAAFRTGNQANRLEAVKLLEALEEVEKF